MRVAVLTVSGCKASSLVGDSPTTGYKLYFDKEHFFLVCSKSVYEEVLARLERNEEVDVRVELVTPP